jgi:TolB-like protein
MGRQLNLAREPPFRLGGVLVRPATLEVERAGVCETLEPRVMEVLVALGRARGEVLSRDALIEACWGGRVVGEDALNRVLSRIRKLAAASGGRDFALETITKVGWRLVAATDAAAPAATAYSGPAAPTSPFTGAAATLAVLPFVDMSERKDQEHLAHGISEELIDQLSRIEGLQVTGRASSFAFEGRNEDLRAIGATLGVSHLLEGSVRRSGNRVRLNAQLVDAASGYQLWSERYDRELGDLFVIESDVAAEVARALSLRLAVGDPADWTRDAEAHDLVLRARAEAKAGAEGMLRAVELLRAAVARDPEYLAAWFDLARCLEFSARFFHPERMEEAFRERDAIAARLLSDRRLAGALDAGAHLRFVFAMYRGDLSTARRMFEVLRRNLSPAARRKCLLPAATLNLKVGRFSEALRCLRERARIDPLDLDTQGLMMTALHGLGRLDEAEAVYRSSVSLANGIGGAAGRAGMEAYGVFLALEAGDRARAAERNARLAQHAPPGWRRQASDAMSALDDREEALAGLRRELEQARRLDAPGPPLIKLAAWASWFDDADLAVDALGLLLERGGMAGPPDLFSPLVARVRRHPRFKDLVRRYGYYDYWRATGEWSDFARPAGEDDFECWSTPVAENVNGIGD